MIYDTLRELQRFNLDLNIFDFLESINVCKVVCSYFTTNMSFTKFIGLIDEVTAEDYQKLRDHFKKRSYIEISFSGFSGNVVMNVQELLDFVISECSIERLKLIDLSMCTQITRLPQLPRVEYGQYDSDFVFHIPEMNNCCAWCNSTQICLTGCFELFTREIYPQLNYMAVTVLFQTSAFFAGIGVKKSRNELPFLLLHELQAFPRNLVNNVSTTNLAKATYQLNRNCCDVYFGKYIFGLIVVMDDLTSETVWKINRITKRNKNKKNKDKKDKKNNKDKKDKKNNKDKKDNHKDNDHSNTTSNTMEV